MTTVAVIRTPATHRICQVCNDVSGPGIVICPNCGCELFRPISKEEAKEPRITHELAGRPVLSSHYSPFEVKVKKTNAFVL